MSNRIMLNQTSYHGAGAVREIPGEIKARGFKKALVVCGPSILKRSNEINQMMKVIGEEGTSAEDYIVYQKGELLDAVYLQQNSFDPIDAACEPERQAHEFNVLYDVLTRDYALSDKKEIRAFFNQVRQEFLDWHGTVYGTPEFAAQETKLTDLYRSKVTG